MSKWAWCLEKEDDTLATGWNQIGDYWYYFYSNGSMATGWLKLEDKFYYLNENGQMQTGWVKDNDKWYYLIEIFNPNQAEYKGQMVCNCMREIGGKTYSFNADGSMAENTNLLSDKGADFIGSWEGFWEKADYDPCYPGVEKYITIGYGTTMEARPDVFTDGINTKCIVEQAREWLEEEAQSCAKIIKSDLDSKGVSLNQNELDAFISFAYNCGARALIGSTLYKNICSGVKDSNTITSNFQAWSKANGVTVPGLYKRRTSESALFLNADYTGNV